MCMYIWHARIQKILLGAGSGGGVGGPSDNFVCRVWRDGERMQFVFFGNSTI